MAEMTPTRPPKGVIPDDALLVDYKTARRMLGGLAQSTMENLVALGPDNGGIASVTVGVPGSRKPRRMFRPADLEAYIERRMQEAS